MFDWLKKFGKAKATPLRGAPAVRRQKTYSAQSGYVYQYYYEGQRALSRGKGSGTEYVFDVSADRKTSFPVSVFLEDEALAPWERSRSRALVSNERYAIAKMGLFQAFDERENPDLMRNEVRLDPKDIEQILKSLSID